MKKPVIKLSDKGFECVLRRLRYLDIPSFTTIKYQKKPFFSGTTVIPPCGKVPGVEELKSMVEASLDGWLTTGCFNAEFEKKLVMFIGANVRISGDLTHADNMMNNNFWIGVQTALTQEMLEFSASKIEAFLDMNCSK